MEIIIKRKDSLDIINGFWLNSYNNSIVFKCPDYRFDIEFETEENAKKSFEKISILIKYACQNNENLYIDIGGLDGVK